MDPTYKDDLVKIKDELNHTNNELDKEILDRINIAERTELYRGRDTSVYCLLEFCKGALITTNNDDLNTKLKEYISVFREWYDYIRYITAP